ncbi:hypothetical protein [Paenibacillus xylanexedens]|uniref:hypothetical protein n=1 Tax=Paenibacillus xylanexedens TaxID=528191 RepID=UPI001980958A|nr:hypothetical protein [Paenibacillus xylanexedens]
MKIKSVIITTIIMFMMLFVVPLNTSSYADGKEDIQTEIPIIVTTQSHGEGGW